MIALRKAPSSYDERFMDTMANEYLERTPWTELRLEAVRDLVDPQPGDRILDLGCAAGAMTHYLSTFGAASVGIDFEELAIAKARQLFPKCAFEVADATALPFDDASFDLVVSYNSLIDVDDMPAAVTEAGRVLRSGGCFCACVPHPFSEAGEFTSNDADAAFIVEGSYLQEADYELVSERNGIVFHFVSRRFPLESYARALEGAGSRSKRCASHRSLASIATVGCACRSSCSGAR